MTTNRMGLEQTLSDGELTVITDTDHVQCGDAAAMARELLAYRKAYKPVMFIDGDISPNDAEKLAAAIREFNSEPSDSVCMVESFPPLQAMTVPDEMKVEDVPKSVTIFKHHRDCYADGWNACRAAMLKSVTNEP